MTEAVLEGVLWPTLAASRGEAGGDELGVTKKSELLRRCVTSGILLLLSEVSTSTTGGREWGSELQCVPLDSECNSGSCLVPLFGTSSLCLLSGVDIAPVRCAGKELVRRLLSGEVGTVEVCLCASGEVAVRGGKGGLWTGEGLGG